MHALEWIAQHGRFRRQISCHQLRKSLERQPGECTWCGQAVTAKRRKTWCSKECVDAYLERCPDRIRSKVFKRDRGICQLCGFDASRVESLLIRLRSLALGWSRTEIQEAAWRPVLEAYVSQLNGLGFRVGRLGACCRLHEVDHIIPVVEGGGMATVDGFRVLCLLCHKRVSGELRKRMARQRKEDEKCPKVHSSSGRSS